MSFIAVGLSVGGSLLSGALASRGADKAQDAARQSSKEDRDFAREMWNNELTAGRSNQTSDFGELKWTKDPQTGQWTQTNMMNPAEAARLGDFRQIAADRMGQAKRLSANLPQGAINYDALGLGKYASAVGVQGGGNSENPNAGRQYKVPDAGRPQGMPSWGANQQRPMSGGGQALGGSMPQGGPMQPPPQPGGPGPANLPGGMQPYQPTPIVPPPAAGAAPPPAAAPAPAAPEKPGADINQYLLNPGLVQAPGGYEDDVLKEIRKHDPNAYFTNAAMDGTDSAAQGRQLKYDQSIISGLLRK